VIHNPVGRVKLENIQQAMHEVALAFEALDILRISEPLLGSYQAEWLPAIQRDLQSQQAERVQVKTAQVLDGRPPLQLNQVNEEHHRLQLATQATLLLGQGVAAPQMSDPTWDAHTATTTRPNPSHMVLEVGADRLAIGDRRADSRAKVGRHHSGRRPHPLV
jgi:hypothetical protein